MSILNCVRVYANHTDLDDFKEQFPDMISDGKWAIRRTALEKAVHMPFGRKVPIYIKNTLLAPTKETSYTFDKLLEFNDLTKRVTVEVAPVLAALDAKRGTLACRFDEVDGNLKVFANAHLVKLLSELFPDADWYALSKKQPLLLVENEEKEKEEEKIVAILMPVDYTKHVPGFNDKLNRHKALTGKKQTVSQNV